MARILLTNDDGVMSPGLWALRRVLSKLGETIVIAPDRPRSATSVSLTFHKPLRISRVSVDQVEAFSVSGNPADCVSLGINKALKGSKPSVVVSGLNPGDNTSVQVVVTSGTVAAAIQASIMGIPAVAFSAVVTDESSTVEEYETKLGRGLDIAARIVHWIIVNGLPQGVDFLNVNFPSHIGERTPVRITKLARRRYDDFVVERLDPRKRPYFWQTGSLLSAEQYDKDTDVYAAHVEHAVSITPMSLDMSTSMNTGALRKLLLKLRDCPSKEPGK